MQMRINAETAAPDGRALPSAGSVLRWEMPTGRGVRVDAGARPGTVVNPNYDPLLAKVIVQVAQADFGALIRKARRALSEVRVAGVETNAQFLEALLERPEVAAGDVDTRFIERNGAELAKAAALRAEGEGLAAAIEDAVPAIAVEAPPGMEAVVAPMSGRLAAVGVVEGALVRRGQCVAVIEAMKMEHLVESGVSGIVRRILVEDGAIVGTGSAILLVESAAHAEAIEQEARTIDLDEIRPDLAEVIARHAKGLDKQRPDAVAKRRASGQRTARENVEDLCDEGSFVEYGALAVAAQRRRRDMADLIAKTPADGVITGIGTVNGPLFGAEAARAAVLAYDFTVLAGTQGLFQPQEDGPGPGSCRPVASAGRRLRRGRRRPPGRHRCSGGRRARRDDVRRLRAAVGNGAAGRNRLRALLCRQRRACRLVRRRHRDQGLQSRDGRPGHDRRGRARRLPARGNRAARRAEAQRRRRHRLRRRSRGDVDRKALSVLFPGKP